MKRVTRDTRHGQNNPSGDGRLQLHEQIEQRAYELWLEGGGRHGNDFGDWLQAEREVLEQRAAASSSPDAD